MILLKQKRSLLLVILQSTVVFILLFFILVSIFIYIVFQLYIPLACLVVTFKYMGQISLPRLEKINVSMSWESGLLYNKQSWASPKLHMLNTLLIKYFFHKTFLVKVSLWRRLRSRNFFTPFCNINKSFNLARSTKKNFFGRFYRPKFVSHYIYYSNNKYTALTVYSAHSRKFK